MDANIDNKDEILSELKSFFLLSDAILSALDEFDNGESYEGKLVTEILVIYVCTSSISEQN